MRCIVSRLSWGILSLSGAFCLGVIALNRGEKINALWILVAAISVYLIAYRFYSRYIAHRVLQVDATRMTPAYRHNDGLDYVPTNKYVLYGHHFAAIAGAGPLVGPVLAAQMGYLPGMLWILSGVVLAGAVQDFIVLFISTRRDGRSIGDLIKQELGTVPGLIALFGTLLIVVILLAVLALIVVKALTNSPWGTFTVAATIPIALFMGIYSRYFRPGRIGEISLIGFVLMMLAIVYGKDIANYPELSAFFTLDGVELTIALMIYGAIAAIVPVWLLLAPRDYLSTFLKIGTIVGLAIGIIIIAPELQLPATTRFIDGTGPVWSGSVFPFLFVTIACGAVSGFHSLIASGTTPKMLENENQAAFIGYGGMLMESFVAMMALIAAAVIDPGLYFAMNSPIAVLGGASVEAAAATVSQWGFEITPQALTHYAQEVGEQSIVSRAGGAPTLAIGMAYILNQAISWISVSFWYHFAILFEALFILTALDAGTRAARFMLQDLLGIFIPPLKHTDSIVANVTATVLCVSAWGYFLYQGVIDPLGGINTLWPLFGIANQMLAVIALTFSTVILFKMKRQRYVWITAIPAIFVCITTTLAGLEKIFHHDPRIGFLALVDKYQTAIDKGVLLAPAKSLQQMKTLIFNNQLNAAMTALFLGIMFSIIYFSLRAMKQAYQCSELTSLEVPYQPLPAHAMK